MLLLAEEGRQIPLLEEHFKSIAARVLRMDRERIECIPTAQCARPRLDDGNGTQNSAGVEPAHTGLGTRSAERRMHRRLCGESAHAHFLTMNPEVRQLLDELSAEPAATIQAFAA